MRFEKNSEDRYTTIKLLENKLNSEISPKLKSEFALLTNAGTQNVILNLDGVAYADSSGLSALLVANRLCESAGGILMICNVGDHIQTLINISQLQTVLKVLPTEAEARDAVFMHELEQEVAQSGETEAN